MKFPMKFRVKFMVSAFLVTLIAGCASPAKNPSTTQSSLQGMIAIQPLDALCAPPAGWTIDRTESNSSHNQQVWASPLGGTAYGVIRFNLPLPVGPDLALIGFISEMKKSEGQATLLSKEKSDRGLLFVVEGGRYVVRGIIVTDGFHGWAVYAGTKRDRPIDVDDLALAVHARDSTILGLGESAGGR